MHTLFISTLASVHVQVTLACSSTLFQSREIGTLRSPAQAPRRTAETLQTRRHRIAVDQLAKRQVHPLTVGRFQPLTIYFLAHCKNQF